MIYPLDRLRITATGWNKGVYTHDNVPLELKPYVKKAMEELRDSGHPTIARTYHTDNGTALSVWYKPKWTKVTYEIQNDPWAGIAGRKWIKRIKEWP